MNNRRPLIVAGLIFLVMAIVHLVRYFYPFSLVIAGYNIPPLWSLIGGVVLIILSGWMFFAPRSRY